MKATWFTAPKGCIGIVVTKDKYKGEVAYIGQCQEGNTEKEDIQYIINYGAKFPIEAAKKLFEI